ncbi:hypothetical protein [Kutzneria sp. CA-103260]|uniref:hypothetical protein n=1 Tax=Kutzneria sp. CA-103260 TaxID=2802641 RepID=UPI001BA7D8AF|nr:hypothetical protein [Kutzneria sp. CA-103260]QUQ63947.1 hypothetical protein JJ691_16640 [Kutzneria sp. CA-103260]
MTVREQIVKLVIAAGEEVTEHDLDAAGGSLSAVNFTSLSYIRLIDSIENELGVYLEAEPGQLATVDDIAALVQAAR